MVDPLILERNGEVISFKSVSKSAKGVEGTTNKSSQRRIKNLQNI